jgi:hypothetical protein
MRILPRYALALLFGFLAVLILKVQKSEPPKHDTLPPGFSLICNGKGEYYPAAKEYDFLWMSPMTKQKSIDLAWNTYEWKAKQENKLTEFKPCN